MTKRNTNDERRTTKRVYGLATKALAAFMAGVFIFISTLGWAGEERLFSTAIENNAYSSSPANNNKLAPPSRLNSEDFKTSLTVAAICKHIEDNGNLDDKSYLNDILARLDTANPNIIVLPHEIIIEIPNENLAVRYFDPTQANVITSYSDVRKLSTKIIGPGLNRQIIHRAKAFIVSPIMPIVVVMPDKHRKVVANFPSAALIKNIDARSSCDIYKGRLSGRSVAIKRYKSDLITNPVIWDIKYEEFLREIRIARKLFELGAGPEIYGPVNIDSESFAFAVEALKGKSIRDMTADEIRQYVSEDTVRQAVSAFKRIREAGIYEKERSQFIVLTEDQHVCGKNLKKGDVVFIDAAAFAENMPTMGRSPEQFEKSLRRQIEKTLRGGAQKPGEASAGREQILFNGEDIYTNRDDYELIDQPLRGVRGVKKILVVMMDYPDVKYGIGDEVIEMHIVDALRDKFGQAKIDVLSRYPDLWLGRNDLSVLPLESLIGEGSNPLLVHDVQSGKVEVSANSAAYETIQARLEEKGYDLVVGLSSPAKLSSILMNISNTALVNIRQRLEEPKCFIYKDGNKVFKTVLAHVGIRLGRNRELLNDKLFASFGLDIDGQRAVIRLKDEEKIDRKRFLEQFGIGGSDRPIVLINPFSSSKHKEWNHGAWFIVAKRLVEAGNILLISSGTTREEAEFARHIHASVVGAGGGGKAVLLSSLKLREFIGHIQLSDLAISVDTGSCHIASRLEDGPAILTLMGGTSGAEQAPVGSMSFFVESLGAIYGRHSYEELSEINIDPAVVARASLEIISTLGGRRAYNEEYALVKSIVDKTKEYKESSDLNNWRRVTDAVNAYRRYAGHDEEYSRFVFGFFDDLKLEVENLLSNKNIDAAIERWQESNTFRYIHFIYDNTHPPVSIRPSSQYAGFDHIAGHVYDNEVELIDLDRVLADEKAVGAVRASILQAYEKHAPCTEEEMEKILRNRVTIDLSEKAKANIVYIDRREYPVNTGKVNVTHIIGYRGEEYHLFLRTKPYSFGHFVLGRGAGEQRISSSKEVSLFLCFVKLLGEDYEGLFNGNNTSDPNFHGQFIKRGFTTVWDVSQSDWPAENKRLEDKDLERLSYQVFQELQRYKELGINCDMSFRHDGGIYRVIIYPRKKVKPDNFLKDIRAYHNFGCMEMAGFAVTLNSEEALGELVADPALYVNALKDVSAGHQRINQNSYRALIADTQRLAGVDAVIADFDGVEYVQTVGGEKIMPHEVQALKEQFFGLGVLNCTITGEERGKFLERVGGIDAIARQAPCYFLTRAGSVAEVAYRDGRRNSIAGEDYKTYNLGDEASVTRIKGIIDLMIKKALVEALLPEALAETADIYGSSHGLTIDVVNTAELHNIRHRIADLVRAEIDKMIKAGKLPGTTTVSSSFGAVDVMPVTKGFSAIQMIKKFKLKRVVLIGDSIGTEENPGGDRSMLTLTQEDLRRAGIGWDVDLIQLYAGNEKDAEIPDHVYVIPETEKRIAPSIGIYEAVIKAKRSQPIAVYVDRNKAAFEDMLGEGKPDTLVRVPVEAIEFVGVDNIKSFLAEFQKAPNGYVELYYMSGVGKVGEGVYQKYGLQNKSVPENFKKTRENTVTLFPVFKGEDIGQADIVSRLGSVDIYPQDTILSPIGLQNDTAGIIRATILGLKIMNIARQAKQGKLINKDAVHVDILNQLRNVLDPADFKNFDLTPDDIIALATGNINNILNALKKLIKLLPIAPINAEELRQVYEHAKEVITSA